MFGLCCIIVYLFPSPLNMHIISKSNCLIHFKYVYILYLRKTIFFGSLHGIRAWGFFFCWQKDTPWYYKIIRNTKVVLDIPIDSLVLSSWPIWCVYTITTHSFLYIDVQYSLLSPSPELGFMTLDLWTQVPLDLCIMGRNFIACSSTSMIYSCS